MVWSVSFGNTSNKGINHEIELTFRHDEWSDKVNSLYIKYRLIPGDVNSEKVSCKYCILSGMESQELYACCRQDIHVRIYKNIPTKEARKRLIAQLVEGQAKVIYDNRTRERYLDRQYNRAMRRQSKENYNLHQALPDYFKKKRADAIDTIRNYELRSGLLGSFTYTVQKKYLWVFKFQAGQTMKIKHRKTSKVIPAAPHWLST